MAEAILREMAAKAAETSVAEGIKPWISSDDLDGEEIADGATPAADLGGTINHATEPCKKQTDAQCSQPIAKPRASNPLPSHHSECDQAENKLLDIEDKYLDLEDSLKTFVASHTASLVEPEYAMELPPTHEIFLPHFALGIGLDDGIELLLAEQNTLSMDNVDILSRVQDRLETMMSRLREELHLRTDQEMH